MCLPPRETNNDVAHESARRRRVVPAGQHGSRRLPTHTTTSSSSTRRVDHHGLPRVSFQHKDDTVIHYIPTALSCLLLVSSANTDTTTTNTSTKTLSMEERRRQLWYNRTDIQEFRRQAQTISQRMRKLQDNDDSDDDDDDDTDEQEDDTRGLEVRMSFSRQDHKQLIVRRILQAQQDDSTPEELAQISQQHSMWSRKLALAQAHKDYYAVYHPHLTSLSNVPLELPSIVLNCHRDVLRSNTTTSCNNKRSLLLMGTSLEQSGRRVRCRMY